MSWIHTEALQACVRPSRPYPPGLCAYLADLLISPLRLRRGEGDQPAEQRGDQLAPVAKPEQILASGAFFPFATKKGKTRFWLASEVAKVRCPPQVRRMQQAQANRRCACTRLSPCTICQATLSWCLPKLCTRTVWPSKPSDAAHPHSTTHSGPPSPVRGPPGHIDQGCAHTLPTC